MYPLKRTGNKGFCFICCDKPLYNQETGWRIAFLPPHAERWRGLLLMRAQKLIRIMFVLFIYHLASIGATKSPLGTK